VAIGLIVQANLMRVVGPPGDQNVLGILDLRFPAVTSLLWATAGSALTIWSRKVTSRALWISGAVLLVASAVKLVLFDFGSLGQLANILAVIAAGGMFLLVGWLAPIPPSAPDEEKPRNESPPVDPTPQPSGGAHASAARGDVHVSRVDGKLSMTDEEIDASNRRTAWTIGIVVVVLVLVASQSARHALGLLRLIG